MTTRTLVMVGAVLEATAGCALIANPDLFAQLLIGASLATGGVVVGRVGGFALLSFGLACWPSKDVAPQVILALFTYNLLVALYVVFVGVVGGFAGYLLWPVCALHALLALMLARPAYEQLIKGSSGSPSPA
jgi:hypothetical protein